MLWTFLALLLHAQREIYLMTKILPLRTGTQATKQAVSLLAHVGSLYDLIKRAYIEHDVALLSEAHEMNQDIFYKKGYALLERSKGKETLALYHIVAAARIFYQANSPLAGFLV